MQGFVADIGGTHARFAIIDLESSEIIARETYISRDQPNLAKAFLHFKAAYQEIWPQMGCIAAACPINETGTIEFTNSEWHFSRQDLQEKMEWEKIEVINDFVSQALAIPVLTPEQVIKIGDGQPHPNRPVGIIGPGTGLGVAGLCFYNGIPLPIATEGGHTDFAPTTEQQIQILKFLRGKFDRVSNERVLAGRGIENLYAALHHLKEKPVKTLNAAEIGNLALKKQCPIAEETLDLFFSILGSVAGNLALTLGAQGGIYIGGGIIPRYVDIIDSNDFRHSFCEKGRFKPYLNKIPTYVIITPDTGLIGAAQGLKNALRNH